MVELEPPHANQPLLLSSLVILMQRKRVSARRCNKAIGSVVFGCSGKIGVLCNLGCYLDHAADWPQNPLVPQCRIISIVDPDSEKDATQGIVSLNVARAVSHVAVMCHRNEEEGYDQGHRYCRKNSSIDRALYRMTVWALLTALARVTNQGQPLILSLDFDSRAVCGRGPVQSRGAL